MVTAQGDFHHPRKLEKNFEENLKKVIKCVEEGMTPQFACVYVFGISEKHYFKWIQYAEDDIAHGFNASESNLILLMRKLAVADASVRYQMEKKGKQLALNDDNVDLLKFFLERRYGYTKTAKSEVELSGKEEAPIKFEFADMTPTENED